MLNHKLGETMNTKKEAFVGRLTYVLSWVIIGGGNSINRESCLG